MVIALLCVATVVLFKAIVFVAVVLGIGFLLWMPLHTVFFGPQSTWRMLCEGKARWAARLSGLRSRIASALPSMGHLAMEVAGGALVGMAVTALAVEPQPWAGALVGGAAGVILAMAHLRRESTSHQQ